VQDLAAERGVARGDRLIRVVGQPQQLALGQRVHGDGARAPVEEGGLAEGRDRVDHSARRFQPAVHEQVQRAVLRAGAEHVLAGPEEARVGVLEQRLPVVVAAVGEEPGQPLRELRFRGVMEEACGVHQGLIRVTVSSP
jgi:hypothetical protein